MKLSNPQTFAYKHPNFGGNVTTANLNQNEVIGGFLDLTIVAPDGRTGVAQLQFQDNGNVVVRVHVSPSNPIKPLIIDDGGQVYP